MNEFESILQEAIRRGYLTQHELDVELGNKSQPNNSIFGRDLVDFVCELQQIFEEEMD